MPELRRVLSYSRMLNSSNFNKEQLRAVNWNGGSLLVLAGPGSGKTTVLTNHIEFLLNQDISSEKILVITFTKDAALNMQNRFMENTSNSSFVTFATFHSFFYQILRYNHSSDKLSIITLSDKRKIITPLLKKYIFKDAYTEPNELSEKADLFLTAFGYYKNTFDIEKACMKADGCKPDVFKKILESYQQILQSRKMIDYDDMLYECLRELEQEPQMLEYWQNRFAYILIDEFQDINPIQYKIISLLAKDKAVVYAVGDDDQAIYGFRGSDPEIMQRFVNDYHAKVICLSTNYRSTDSIVNASETVIKENKIRMGKTMKSSHSGSNSGFFTQAFQSRQEEIAAIIQLAEEHYKSYPNGESTLTVLFRTNTYMQSMAARFSAAGVPYTMKEKCNNIYDHFIVKDILAYLQLAAVKWDIEHFVRIMNRPTRYISREAVSESRSLEDVIQYYKSNAKVMRGSREQIEALRLLQRQLMILKNLSLVAGIQFVLKTMHYERYLKAVYAGNEDKLMEMEELLLWLKNDASNFKMLEEWLEFQKLYAENMNQQKEAGNEGNAVKLMTIHASKGLEFDTVLIPDCNEKMYPPAVNAANEKDVEEERRIFYVAMTRAKKKLVLMYVRGSENRRRVPSRFIKKLI